MGTLAQTLNTLSIQAMPPRVKGVIKCFKTKRELQISASSEEFFYVKFPLRRIALSASTRRDGDVIILDSNVHKVGKTFGGFVSKVYIVRGHSKVAELQANGSLFCNVWVGEQVIKKLNIQADDAISLNDLQTKLGNLLSRQYPANSNIGDCSPGGYAWIRDVYPFENYFIFDRKGNHYKQAYVCDPVSQEVALAGKPVRVYEEYTEVPKGLTSPAGKGAETATKAIAAEGPILSLPIVPSGVANYVRTMSQEIAFDKVNGPDAITLGSRHGSGIATPETFTTFGAPTSELNNPPIKTMTNIEEALQMYLYDLADGTYRPTVSNGPMRASRDYQYAVREAEIVASEADKKINVHDFIRWQTNMLNASAKTKFGKLYVAYGEGDRDDPSTWIKAAGNPNSGSKFRVGDKVKTRHGKGKITAKHAKDIFEVTHASGKKGKFSKQEVEAV